MGGIFMKRFSILFLLASFFFCFSSLKAEDASFKFNGFVDTYFATDNDNVVQSDGFNNSRQYSLINSQKNTFGLNIAQLCLHGQYGAARGNLVLHYGELAQNTFEASGSSVLVQQANVGLRLCEDFWVDGGYFLSHIGDESLNPGHNWLSSYSLLRLYQPFFQAGLRFGYETEKFTARLYVLNAKGTFKENNFNKTFGVYLRYSPMENFKISYGNLIGNEEPGKPQYSRTQMLHNVCGEYEFSPSFALKGDLDYSTYENLNGIDPATEFGISVQGHYKFNPQWSATARFAMLNRTEPNQTDFSGNHITIGGEYNPTSNTYCRLEGSYLTFGNDYRPFLDADSKPTNSRMELVLNFGVFFNGTK